VSNWQYGTQLAGNAAAPVQSGGGGQVISFRDPLDARRAQMGFVPTAEYPDGYLGVIQSRREDRLLNSLKNRLNQRSYQRGVHKGEKVDPADYLWPPELDPMSGIARQARTGLRAAPLMTAREQIEGGMLPRGAAGLAVNPLVREDLRSLSPNWK
jgi:hypothetical protein